MLTTYVNDVTQDQAILVYAILTGKSIDVGKLLAHQMVHNLHMKGVGSFYFSIIITVFYVAACVK